MKQSYFEEQNMQFWQYMNHLIQSLEKKPKSAKQHDKIKFAGNYRLLCQHLALAQSRAYSPNLIEYLQRLCERSYALLYQRKPHLWQQLKSFITTDFPKTVIQQKKWIILAHLLFYVPLILCFGIIAFKPELSDAMIDIQMLEQASSSYHEMANQYQQGQNRAFSLDIMMFAHYIFNNIGIAFKTFIGGILFGIGTIYITITNGYSIGGIMGYMAHDASAKTFFSFIIAHGAFELTGIVFAAAGGLKLGSSMLFPNGYSRLEAMKKEGRVAGILMGGAFVMLFIAAIIEGFWSPLTALPMLFKYVVGACFWIVMYWYLLSARKRG